jgi:hypothetical protein
MTRSQAIEDKDAFSISIVVGLVVVGILSFAALIVLSAFADDLRRPDDGGAHVLSKSAVGYAGILSLLQSEGRAVRVSRGPLDATGGDDEVVVLTPRVGDALTAQDLYQIPGDVLIVLPKWATLPSPENREWVRSSGPYDIGRVERTLSEFGFDVKVRRIARSDEIMLVDHEFGRTTFAAGRISRLQTVSGVHVTPVLAAPSGEAVLAKIVDHNNRYIYILADPDLLNTQGIASVVTARAGLRVFERAAPGNQSVVFDMTLLGVKHARNFLKLLFEPPFLPAALCLVFAAGLIAVNAFAGGLRTKDQREIALGKAILVENSALLVSLASRDLHMGRRYVALIRSQASNAVGVPPKSSEEQRTAMLDAATRHSDEPAFSTLAAEVSGARTPTTLLRAVNRLYRWRQEIGREQRRS